MPVLPEFGEEQPRPGMHLQFLYPDSEELKEAQQT